VATAFVIRSIGSDRSEVVRAPIYTGTISMVLRTFLQEIRGYQQRMDLAPKLVIALRSVNLLQAGISVWAKTYDKSAIVKRCCGHIPEQIRIG
jgi:hypothetical protein